MNNLRLKFWRLLHSTSEWLWHWSWRHMEPLLPPYSSYPIIYSERYQGYVTTIYDLNTMPPIAIDDPTWNWTERGPIR